jgi:hypothetical protein
MTRGVNDGIRRVQQGVVGNEQEDEYDVAEMAP